MSEPSMTRENDPALDRAEPNDEKRCENCGEVTGAAASFSEGSERYLRLSTVGPTSPLANPDEKGAFAPDGEHSLMGESTTEYYCSEDCAVETLSERRERGDNA